MSSTNIIKKELNIIARFTTIGFFGTSLHALIYFLAFEIYNIESLVANFLAFFISFFFSYFGHSSFSFANHIEKHDINWSLRWRFFQGTFLGFILNTCWSYLFIDLYGLSSTVYIFALFTLTPALSFSLNRFWVFVPQFK